MNNELPKIDLPINCITGTDITKDLLNLYADSPCRLKAGIFVLLLDGDIDASINLVRYKIQPMSFVTILPQSILQIHKANGNLKIYFIGFSSEFLQNNNLFKIIPEHYYQMRENPIIRLDDRDVPIYKHYLELMLKAQENGYLLANDEISKATLSLILSYLKETYKKIAPYDSTLVKSKKIAKEFSELVIQNYMKERNVSFYADKLRITAAHLSTTIKETTGKTCTEIISAMVIMDAKTQLKSTDIPIYQIADSLNFCNVSFFGKYFKRYVGVGPQEYRNS